MGPVTQSRTASVKPYRVGRQFVWVSGGRVLAAVLQALSMVLLVRSVSPAEFGFFAATYGVITIPQTLMDLGLPTLVIRERAKDSSARVVTAALQLNNRLAAVMAVALLLALTVLGFTANSQFLLLLPFAIWAAAERNADAWLGVVFADGDAWVNTLNLVGRRLGNLALFTVLTTSTGLDPVLAFALSSAGAAVVSWSFAHRYVAPRLPAPTAMTARSLVAQSYPYWINSVATQARNLDTAVASIVAGTGQAGLYAASSRLTNPLRILPTSLASVLLPAASKRTSRTMGPLVTLVGASTAGFAALYGVLALVIPLGVPLVLGEDYRGAVPALQITALGLIFASAASLLGAVLQGVGLKSTVATAAVVTTATCLVGVALGGATAGATGAAVGLAASYVLQSGALLGRLVLFSHRKEPNR